MLFIDIMWIRSKNKPDPDVLRSAVSRKKLKL